MSYVYFKSVKFGSVFSYLSVDLKYKAPDVLFYIITKLYKVHLA